MIYLLFFYPIFMSLIWIVFSIVFFIKSEVSFKKKTTSKPFISILIPCYNEEAHIDKTINQLLTTIDYPNYEIITINDGSSDNTLKHLINLTNQYQNIRVCNVETNLGKAHALIQGAIFSKAEFLLCLDADATVDKHALHAMVQNFLGKSNQDVGAVTGNPIVKNRKTFIGKIQTVEFLSIIGLIKRAQSIFGTLNTVSGVCVMFRKGALLDVGWWDQECITEDISITWRLQRKHWRILFEPDAVCWMLVPEKLSSLFKQRLRWSQGGIEVLLKNADIFLGRQFNFGLIVLYLEQLSSIIWSILWYSLLPVILAKGIIFRDIQMITLILTVIITVFSIFQYLLSIFINLKYDFKLLGTSFFAIWYILLYWVINPITLLIAIPYGIRTYLKGGQAVWESPDRGGGNG